MGNTTLSYFVNYEFTQRTLSDHLKTGSNLSFLAFCAEWIYFNLSKYEYVQDTHVKSPAPREHASIFALLHFPLQNHWFFLKLFWVSASVSLEIFSCFSRSMWTTTSEIQQWNIVWNCTVLIQCSPALCAISACRTGEFYQLKHHMDVFWCAPVLSSVSVQPSKQGLSSIYRRDTHMCHSPETEAATERGLK